MVNIFIEMGQGIVAEGDFGVSTSPLSTCTFMGGYSSRTGKAGAFHIPGNGWKDSFIDIVIWQEELKPSEIVLVTGTHENLGDNTKARAWFEDDEDNCSVELLRDNGAAMVSNPFKVLQPFEIPGYNFDKDINASRFIAQSYNFGDFKYQIFGKNLK